MPALRKLTSPLSLWLIVLITTAGLILLDSCRSPGDQASVKIYVAGIRLYQKTCAPLVSRFVRCRYRPTCSEYCIQAAQRHGIRRGLVLGIKRIFSCTKDIPCGRYDPVPE